MESKKINQLATELAPDLSDLTIIGDPTTGISKKITLSQMASLFTGTVEEYANLAAFPLVGVADTIYIALDTNIIYRWNTGTSAYVELSPNIVSSLVFNDANGFDGTINLVGSVATLTITTALTTGSVGFIGASGALLQDNANFFWDDTNNRLGLGTNAPTTALDVFGSGIIGRLNGTSTNNAYLGFASAGTNKWSIGNVQSDHRFRIFSEANTSELITILQTGEFGIGIANPTTKFHIDGAASALIANLDANVSVAKSISFRSDNSNRINLEVSGTESGSNAGANFFIRRYSDAGALIDTPLTITRSTGAATFSSDVTIGSPTTNAALNISGDNSGGDSFINFKGDIGQIKGQIQGTKNGSTGGIINFKTLQSSVLTTAMTIKEANIGINQINPLYSLDVTGTGRFTGALTIDAFANSATTYITLRNGFAPSSSGGLGFMAIDHSGSGTDGLACYGHDGISLYTAQTERVRISNIGYVGVSTINNADPNPQINFQLGRVFGISQDINSGYVDCNRTTSGNYIVSQYATRIHLDSAQGEIKFSTASSGTAGNAVTFSERMKITNAGSVGINSTGAANIVLFPKGFTSGTGSFTIAAQNSSSSFTFILNDAGNVTISGSLSKGSGSFRIEHPLESLSATHDLVHSFVESPQANNIYRGKVQLINGKAEVNIDEVSTMTEGTFIALNREIHTYTSNETDWDAVRGKVEGNILIIECQNNKSNAIVSWLVIGERQDKHMMDTDWTDDNGKVIVEPLKQIKPQVDIIETETIIEEENTIIEEEVIIEEKEVISQPKTI